MRNLKLVLRFSWKFIFLEYKLNALINHIVFAFAFVQCNRTLRNLINKYVQIICISRHQSLDQSRGGFNFDQRQTARTINQLSEKDPVKQSEQFDNFIEEISSVFIFNAHLKFHRFVTIRVKKLPKPSIDLHLIKSAETFTVQKCLIGLEVKNSQICISPL